MNKNIKLGGTWRCISAVSFSKFGWYELKAILKYNSKCWSVNCDQFFTLITFVNKNADSHKYVILLKVETSNNYLSVS